MIEFAHEWVRTEFHLLPVDDQRYYLEFAEKLLARGRQLNILNVERWKDNVLEVTIRIDKKFNPVPVLETQKP